MRRTVQSAVRRLNTERVASRQQILANKARDAELLAQSQRLDAARLAHASFRAARGVVTLAHDLQSQQGRRKAKGQLRRRVKRLWPFRRRARHEAAVEIQVREGRGDACPVFGAVP